MRANFCDLSALNSGTLASGLDIMRADSCLLCPLVLVLPLWVRFMFMYYS